MKTDFKISQTQQIAQHKIKRSQQMMLQCRINYEQWVTILFEMGCQFVETSIEPEGLQKTFLKKSDIGFWDWWVVIFMDDDIKLLNNANINTLEKYMAEKKRLVFLKETSDKLNHFIKKNEKLNEAI